MKKFNYVIAGLGALLIVVGFIGASNSSNATKDNNLGFLGMYSNANGYESMMNANNSYQNNTNDYYGGMMGRFSNTGYNKLGNNGEKLDVVVLEEKVHEYIERFTEVLEISDIFIYENSDYYFSIVESDTDRGAMELLVNPYTGDIYPEFGPNMMWNIKYGMHYGNRSGMMGNRGMMGRNGYDTEVNYSNVYNKPNEISVEEAYTKGSKYLAEQSGNLELSQSGHEFYGYFTFHVEQDGVTVDMLSVNGYTGEVWFHDWHGELTETIGEHEEL